MTKKSKNLQRQAFLLGNVYFWYQILKEHVEKSVYAKYHGFSLEKWCPNIKNTCFVWFVPKPNQKRSCFQFLVLYFHKGFKNLFWWETEASTTTPSGYTKPEANEFQQNEKTKTKEVLQQSCCNNFVFFNPGKKKKIFPKTEKAINVNSKICKLRMLILSQGNGAYFSQLKQHLTLITFFFFNNKKKQIKIDACQVKTFRNSVCWWHNLLFLFFKISCIFWLDGATISY